MSNYVTENQITLGALIRLLDGLHKRDDDDMKVFFDFCGLSPSGELYSYRGIYAHLCLGATSSYVEPSCTVGSMLATLRDAIGKSFTGWKGGVFVMDETTPLWVSLEQSSCFGTAVVGVRQVGYMVVIQTAYVEY